MIPAEMRIPQFLVAQMVPEAQQIAAILTRRDIGRILGAEQRALIGRKNWRRTHDDRSNLIGMPTGEIEGEGRRRPMRIKRHFAPTESGPHILNLLEPY